METTTALVPITESIAQDFFNSQDIETCLKAIEEDAINFVGDTSTAKGRKSIVAKAASVASAKVIIDTVGKKLNEDRKKLTDIVNADRKKARDFLDDLKLKVRKPVTEWEEAEEARTQAERDAIEYEIDWEAALSEDDLFNRQREVEHKEAELKEQEEARVEKERIEQEEKERVEYEKRIAQEAKERAEREAQEAIEAEKQRVVDEQNRAKEAAEKAERDKKEAIERAEREKQEAIENAKAEEKKRAEKAKEEEEERVATEKRKAEIKARHHAHQKKINREALGSFVENGIKEVQAKEIITMIAHKKINHITLNY